MSQADTDVPGVRVTRGLGDALVRVLPGHTVVHDGAEAFEGDEFTMDMALAQNFASLGYLEIIGASA